MRTRTHRTLLTATAACTALLFTAAGCTDDAKPTPDPTPTTSSAAPSPTKSAWESKYTPAEITQYEAALARFTEYEQRSEPIWAAGKVTPAAEKLFKEYWLTWPVALNKLRFIEQVGDKVIGTAKVISSEPTKVELRAGTADVEIRQCIDPRTITVKHPAGAKVTPTKQGPYIRTLYLAHAKNKPFMITGVLDITSGKKVTPCGP